MQKRVQSKTKGRNTDDHNNSVNRNKDDQRKYTQSEDMQTVIKYETEERA